MFAHKKDENMRQPTVVQVTNKGGLAGSRALSVLMLLIALLLVPCAFGMSTAWAHDLWINMSNHFPEQSESVKAYLGWGHHYPFSDFLSPDRVQSMQVIVPDGKKLCLHPSKEAPGTVIETEKPGTYVVGVAMKPTYYTKTRTGHTFKSKKESKGVISSIWSEKYAKAVFCVGGSTTENYKEEIGHRLEIIPLDDPCRLRAGGRLAIRVLMDGSPVANASVYSSYLGQSENGNIVVPEKTDSNGVATIRLGAPGVWRVRVVNKVISEDQSLCNYKQYVAFLTVGVRKAH